MGVKDFWTIVDPIKETVPFSDLLNQTVAVDLSMWIVDSQCVKQMMGTVTKPYLRNLFFRTSALLNADVIPLFVTEGKAPELKWQTMIDRIGARCGSISLGNKYRKPQAKQSQNRTKLKSVTKECCQLLDSLGLPYVQSDDEAEAMCASLNSDGKVDAVITDDSDSFLYGAKVVYRNFNSTKGTVDRYKLCDVEEKLGIFREHMIALALLIGCDYRPQGVTGVGKMLAFKFIQDTPRDDILTLLKAWEEGVDNTHTNPLCSSIVTVRQKIMKMRSAASEPVIFERIIDEFMNNTHGARVPLVEWKKPLLNKFQDVCLSKLEWPVKYSFEKLFPLMVTWVLRTQLNLHGNNLTYSITPVEIIKKRVKAGVNSFEILWNVTDPYINGEEEEEITSDQMHTVEPQDIIMQCYPDLVENFLQMALKKPIKAKSKTVTRRCRVASPHTTTPSQRMSTNPHLANRQPPILSLPSLDDISDRRVSAVESSLSKCLQPADDREITCRNSNSAISSHPVSTVYGLGSLDYIGDKENFPPAKPCTPGTRRKDDSVIDLCSSEDDLSNLLNHSHINSNQPSPTSIFLKSKPPSDLRVKTLINQARKPRDSLDALLADISTHINQSTPECVSGTPAGQANQFTDSNIVVSHVTPSSFQLQFSDLRPLSYDQETPNTNTRNNRKAGDASNVLDFSDLSLLDVGQEEDNVQPNRLELEIASSLFSDSASALSNDSLLLL